MEAISITRSIDIAAPPERVWAALTTAEGLAKWFPQAATLDLRVGGAGVMTFEGHGDFPFTVEELRPLEVVAYRWAARPDAPADAPPSLARFTLEPIPGGTRVTVVETGFEALPDPDASARGNEQGWEQVFSTLRSLLEQG